VQEWGRHATCMSQSGARVITHDPLLVDGR
jgi:hypothetical protein